MFFPSPTGIISKTISEKINEKTQKKEETRIDWSAIRRTHLCKKDEDDDDPMIKTYGYEKMVYTGKGDNLKSTKSNKTIKIVEGKKLKGGFRQFLSNYGKTTHLVRFRKGVQQDEPVDFNYLQGKYLLICCFNVPMLSLGARNCRAIIDAYNELSQVEMVVVANMKTDVNYNQKAAFDHFYSAFSCLAIPFSDFETRDYIYSCMSNPSLYRDNDLAFFVHPNGIILHDDTILGSFFYYGSDWARFLPTTLDRIDSQDVVLRSKLDPMYLPSYSDRQQPLSLYRDILLCDPLVTLGRFDAMTEELTELFSTVLDLSRKYVGLYLCINGEIMEEIKAVHDYCLANNQQLEIMVIPLPFYDEPKLYNEDLSKALRRLNIKSWFIFDYNSDVCRRLWRIFGLGFTWREEKLIIIPPDCESGELCGREIITNLGINEYPFTRTSIIKRRLEYLRSLTPVFSSLLFNNCQMFQNGKEFKSEQLQGKNVLLYISWSECDLYSLVKKRYPEIKAMGWEVVFVLLDYTDHYWNGEMVDRVVVHPNCPSFDFRVMPWPFMLPRGDAAKACIKEKLFYPEDYCKTSYLFAVGKDGKIVSRDVQHRLDTGGVSESLFDDFLEHDLASGLASIILYDTYN